MSRLPDSDQYGVPSGGEELDDYLADLTDDDLVTLKLDLQEELGDIKLKLQDARARAASKGIYRDRDWYRRTTIAQRIKSTQYNACCVEQGRRKRQQHQLDSLTFERAFMVAVKETLTGAQYDKIVKRAHEIKEQTS